MLCRTEVPVLEVERSESEAEYEEADEEDIEVPR